MEVTGTLHTKFDAQAVSASFTKRDFVLMIADNPQYPQYVQFQFSQEKCGLLDSFQCGASVTIMFNLRGRAWVNPQGETKYFNQLEAWAIRPATANTAEPNIHTSPVTPTPPPAAPIDISKMNDSDDLPF